VKPQMGTTIQ